MPNLTQKTPVPTNYHIVSLIEQLLTPVPKGTALALCDILCAMGSGYFIESGGAIMPAVDQYLRQTIEEEKEREARSRRAAKAITYGQYNLKELVDVQQEMIKGSSEWHETIIQGYKIKAADFTSYKRSSVKNLKSKAYDGDVGRAIPAVSYGLLGSIGQVGEQRMAVPEVMVCGDTTDNAPSKEMTRFYKEVAKAIGEHDLVTFDAGFSLVQAIEAGIENCLIRLAKNSTFGKTVGKIPERQGERGRLPTKHRAEIVRPLARQHGKKVLPATPPDQTLFQTNEDGHEIKIEIWHNLYFLERQIEQVENRSLRNKLRQTPLKVVAIHHPLYKTPQLLGTPCTDLTAESMQQIYPERWPIEGIPQAGKYLLSGGGGRHYVYHPTAMERLPAITMILGSLFKFVAATLPPIKTGFWDRAVKPTYGRLVRHLKKVGLPLSTQLFKKESVTHHLPVGYEAIRLSRA